MWRKISKLRRFTSGQTDVGKNTFYEISKNSARLIRNYFETSHGKNVCDGLGAIVKCSCYSAMLGKKVRGTAEAVFKHCKDNLEITTEQEKVTGQENFISIREFIYVDSQTVNKANLPEVSTLKGTRKIHEIRNTNTVRDVEHRN